MTIIWTILLGVMVKIVMKLLPDRSQKVENPSEPLYLDYNITNQPAAALQLVAKEVIHCSEIVRNMLQKVTNAAQCEQVEVLDEIDRQADIVENLNTSITDYLAELFSKGVLTEEQATQTAKMMYVLSDVERISTLCKDISISIRDKIGRKYNFTDEAMAELEKSLAMIEKMYSDTLAIMENGKQDKAMVILRQKEQIVDLDIEMRKAHIKRVAQGKCSMTLTAPFSQVLHAIERIGNSCVNITETVSSQIDFNYFMIEENK